MNAARPSSACLQHVKRFEGFRAEAVNLGDGRWLIGYGHVRHGAPDRPMGEIEAEFLLKEDLEEVSQVLRAEISVPLNQNQFDALASFGFSIGLAALRGGDVLELLNQGRPLDAAEALEKWRRSAATGAVDADLVRRRAAEKALFLAEDDQAPAPSALLRPVRELAEPAARGGDEPDEPAPGESEAPRDHTDVLAMAALGVLGLVLIAMGVTGADEDRGLSYLIFAGPGAVAVAMSVYYLLKKTVEAV